KGVGERFVENIESDHSSLFECTGKGCHDVQVVRADAVRVRVEFTERRVYTQIGKRVRHPIRAGLVIDRSIKPHQGSKLNTPPGKSFPAPTVQKTRISILMKIDDGVDPAPPRLVHNATKIPQVILRKGSLDGIVRLPHKQQTNDVHTPSRQRIKFGKVRV